MEPGTEPRRDSIASSKQQQRESVWQSADIDSKEILRQLLLSNPWPELITYDGPACTCNVHRSIELTSKGGAQHSSCALISMFCARTILDLEKQLRAREYRSEGRSKEDEASGLLDDILAERTVQRIVSIGQHLKGALPMTPSELLDVPMFEQVFVSPSRVKDLSYYESVLSVLDQLCRDSVRRIASAVITHAGQSVVCVKLSILEDDFFVLFDPHRRDDHLNGPGFMLSKSRTTTANFLNTILSMPLLGSSDEIKDLEDILDACPAAADHFTAHLLDAKECYHKITAYQNEQTLRDSFLCTHEEVLSASIEFVAQESTRHRPSTPDAGPSSPRSSTSHDTISRHSPLLSTSSSTSSTSSSTVSSPERSSNTITPIPITNSRFTRVLAESWPPPEPLYPQSYLEWQIKSMLKNTGSMNFDCAVCFDSVPVSAGVQLHGCEHRFCKDCLKGHVQSSLDNGRYPIECPVCLLDRSVPDPGNVTNYVLGKLQLGEECTDKFVELQTLQHSLRLECPKCTHSEFMNRKEYLLAKVLTCVSADCMTKWCKFCSKIILDSKGKHSCKGDPFEKLMKKKGWRHCPGCTMPVVKDYGCNHMSCVAPGCHSHFCYKCGKLIIQSSTGRGVGEEVTMHYTSGGCKQFEHKWKCSIQ